MEKGDLLSLVEAALVGAALSTVLFFLLSRPSRSRARSLGGSAKSAVTGGHPEDINAMPIAENPDVEGPIYDGSDLPPPPPITAVITAPSKGKTLSLRVATTKPKQPPDP